MRLTRTARALTALAAASLLTALTPPPAQACTTFRLEGEGGARVVGKSYDWHDGGGIVFVNKRGVSKRALLPNPFEKAATWTSKHASVTFNQYGREMPNGGMNDKGLVVEVMWLSGSQYPSMDARPAVNELQWTQYQLDNFATVREVVANAPKIRVSNVYAQVHWMACDAGGACATFEYVDGKLVVHDGAALAAPVLTNDTYDDSEAALKRFHAGSGKKAKRAAPSGNGSLARFVRTAESVRAAAKGPLVDKAFALLDDVRQGTYSKWNIVYEPKAARVHFRTLGSSAIKTIDLGKFDASCKTPVQMLDMSAAKPGDATARFTDFDPAANKALVKRSMGRLQHPMVNLLVGLVAGYPASTTCAAP